MNHPRQLASLLVCLITLSALGCATAAEAKGPAKVTPAPGTAVLQVDLTEAPRRLVHATLRLPARPGPLALAYPQWLPGEHGPTGAIADLVSLQIHAGGQLLQWRRDDEEMFRINVVVPPGATELQLSYDFVSPPATEQGFSSGASMTQHLAMLSWNQVVLYPDGVPAAALHYQASVQLPPGWRFATSLETAGRDGDLVRFQPVSLETLIDSPVLAARHLLEVALGESHGAKVSAALAAETEVELRLPPALRASFEKLVAEEAALFGARHFDRYVFLVTLSDSVAHFGLEHHQSNDSRMPGRTLLDPDLTMQAFGGLLSHESFHSWNGKYRRPAGIVTPDYMTPMKGELLWVYEGLTNYYGDVLAARAGFRDPQTARDYLAYITDQVQGQRGRTWRPLEDTGVAAQVLYPARNDWHSLRRGTDFYSESDLVWLDVDTLLREKSGGSRSLDDFCRKFHGGESSGPKVVPYGLDDVVKALNDLVPFDWRGLLLGRVQKLAEDAPVAGLNRAGWKLGYSDQPSAYWKAHEKVDKVLDLRPSLGLSIDEKSLVVDVIPGRPADRAGVGPAMKVIAVNGRKFTNDRLLAAVEASAADKAPIDLLVENAESYTVLSLDYHGGPRYPRLERLDGTADLLSEILRGRAAK